MDLYIWLLSSECIHLKLLLLKRCNITLSLWGRCYQTIPVTNEKIYNLENFFQNPKNKNCFSCNNSSVSLIKPTVFSRLKLKPAFNIKIIINGFVVLINLVLTFTTLKTVEQPFLFKKKMRKITKWTIN